MKIKNRIYALILSICVFTLVFSNTNLSVKATITENHFITDTIELSGNTYNCFRYTNEDLIPDSLQCYWVQNGVVQHALFGNVLTVMLNKKFGLTFSNNTLQSFISYVFTGVTSVSAIATSVFDGSITRVVKNDAVVGIALDDLNGYKLTDDVTEVTVPSTTVNNFFNITNNYIENNLLTQPDFINIPTLTKTYVLENMYPQEASYVNAQNVINSRSYLFGGMQIQRDMQWYWTVGSGYSGQDKYEYFNTDEFSLIAYDGYNDICSYFNLTTNNNTISLETYLNANFSTIPSLKAYGYDSNNVQLSVSSKNVSGSTYNYSNQYVYLTGSFHELPISNNGYYTVYKSLAIKNQITNNTYSPSFYKSTTYNNYNNTSSENSITINNTQINNSQQTNSNIYNDTRNETNNYANSENNYYYDNSKVDNSTTTIINNYYGDSSGGGDDDDDDDDDDDSIWKALLKAIAGFFEKIGELIATLLTGIFSIFTSILDAITSITDDFTSITSFISSFFSWLPTPITSLIVLGLGLALICAFLTWFKK